MSHPLFSLASDSSVRSTPQNVVAQARRLVSSSHKQTSSVGRSPPCNYSGPWVLSILFLCPVVGFFKKTSIYLGCPRSQVQHVGSSVFVVVAYGIFNCSMWNLVPRPGIKLRPPALGAWSLSHWTARKVFFVQFWVDTLSGVQPMEKGNATSPGLVSRHQGGKGTHHFCHTSLGRMLSHLLHRRWWKVH